VDALGARRDRLADRTAVLSPHLDDAVLSLGAGIARATGEGAEVRIITVLAGDPFSDAAAGPWDRAGGFRSAREAAEARRGEDLEACSIVGAQPVWLPFGDSNYGRGASDNEIWAAVVDAVRGADLVVIPRSPLTHVDHAWLANLVVAKRASLPSCALYVEQPYAYHAGGRTIQKPPAKLRGLAPTPLAWQALPVTSIHRRAKRRAMRSYGSQLRRLSSKRFLALRISMSERRNGGEFVAELPES
jgi:LmbE family N-acetylglucosaminyl deacetylase